MFQRVLVVTFVFLCWTSAFCIADQDTTAHQTEPQRIVTVRPNYLPPSDLFRFLGVEQSGECGVMRWGSAVGTHIVQVRRNDAANLLLLSGADSDIKVVEKLIREGDVPPRQIKIDVKIVEVNRSRAQDIGIDWDRMLDVVQSESRTRFSYDENIREQSEERFTDQGDDFE